MRASFVGSAIKSSIYEVSNGETKFIGILKNKKRITYKTTAGKHTFMVIAESADFMEANLAEDKTYYSVISPRMGLIKARFSMFPFRNDGTSKFHTESKEFEKLKKKTQEVLITDESKAWYDKKKKKFEKKRIKYWKKWKKKTAEEISEKTLNAEDGI